MHTGHWFPACSPPAHHARKLQLHRPLSGERLPEMKQTSCSQVQELSVFLNTKELKVSFRLSGHCSYKLPLKTQWHGQHPCEQMLRYPSTTMRLLTHQQEDAACAVCPRMGSFDLSDSAGPSCDLVRRWILHTAAKWQVRVSESVLGTDRIIPNRRPCGNQSWAKLLISSFNLMTLKYKQEQKRRREDICQLIQSLCQFERQI